MMYLDGGRIGLKVSYWRVGIVEEKQDVVFWLFGVCAQC